MLSHIVSKMWIDNDTGIGMAEYLILGTPVGRTLNTYLRAGSKLRVSTRGIGNTKERSDGTKDIIDFYFQRVDFVINAGFDEALPDIKESLNTQPESGSDETKRKTEMAENQEKEDLGVAKTINVLESNLEETKEELAQSRAELKEKDKEIAEARAALAAYSRFGSAEKVAESLEEKDAKLKEYSELGTPEQVKEALESSEEKINELQAQVDAAVASNAEGVAEDEEDKKELEAYREIGTPEEVSEALHLLRDLTAKHKAVVAEGLASKFRTGKSIVEALLDTKTPEEVEGMLAEAEEEKKAEVPNVDPNSSTEGDLATKLAEDEREEVKTPAEAKDVAESKVRNIIGKRTGGTTLAESMGNNSLAARLLNRSRRTTK